MYRTPYACTRVAVTRWHVVGAAGAHQSIRLSLVTRWYVQIISSEWLIIAFVPFRVGTVDLYLGSEDRTISSYPLRVHLCNSSVSPAATLVSPETYLTRRSLHPLLPIIVSISFKYSFLLIRFLIGPRSLCRRQQHVPSASYVHSCFHSEYRLT